MIWVSKPVSNFASDARRVRNLVGKVKLDENEKRNHIMPVHVVSRCVRIQEVPFSSLVSLLYGKILELSGSKALLYRKR